MLLKIEKTLKIITVEAAQKRTRPAACSASSFWARSPTANGRAAKLAHRGVSLPRPRGLLAGPRTERDPGRRF